MKKMKLRQALKRLFAVGTLVPMGFLFAFPSSTNFQLKSFEFGGGGESMSSTNFQAEGTLGEVAGEQSSTNFKVNSGLQFVQQSNVPGAPTFVNSSSWYNKLLLTIDVANNPSDTLYAVSISDDNWVTTEYIQDDNTVGSTLGIEDYQTYTNWGGGSGEYVIGLLGGVTYKVKVKAKQGDFTESPYGPEASAATIQPSISFDIDVAPTDTETASPYQVSLGEMSVGTVTTATNNVWVDLDSNAESGAYVYIYGQYGGLHSTNVSHTISSSSVDLGGATEGYGIRTNTTSGLTAVAPYAGTSDIVGILDTSVREVLHSSNLPVVAGRASLLIKAKISNVTPSANDYSDTITLIASGSF